MDENTNGGTDWDNLNRFNKGDNFLPQTYQSPIGQTPKPEKTNNKEQGSKLDDDNKDNGFIEQFIALFKIHPDELKLLLRFYPNYEARNKVIVFLLGVLFTPVTLAGGLLGYIRSYNRFYRKNSVIPQFWPMSPVTRIAMLIGVLFLWVLVVIAVLLIRPVIASGRHGNAIVFGYLIANFVISMTVFGFFRLWQIGTKNAVVEGQKFGSAHFANDDELAPYQEQGGIYIGGGYHYSKQGHILTTAGSRSGKFVNLLAPNLLGWGDINGSWVVIDPKGEICACTSEYQRSIGQNIVILNPWDLLAGHIGQAQSYNPFDILDPLNIHFVDDCTMLAEMLVPVETGKNKFFSDSARAVITGLIMYIAISKIDDERTLKTLWKWVRFPQAEWDRILAEMQNSTDEANGENLLYASGEIEKIAKSGGNTWGSVLATILQATEFLKSPALQKALQSGFNPKTLAHKNTTVYIIIPADKLQSHSRWLRLIVTSSMRAVIRNKNKRVVFMLDEFAALGYLPEIETALSTYAGFNVTVWPILQSLVQLQNLYQNNWQVFIGNSAVRQFFGIHNNFDADYISSAIGKKSHVLVTRSWFGIKDAQSNQRDLITPDELRIASGSNIFAFIDDRPPTYFEKLPYYEVPELDERATPNPYYN